MSKSVAEQMAEAIGKVESKELPASPAVETRSYDPNLASAIIDATLELYGGDSHWSVNFKAIDNAGKNAKEQPGVLGAIKTQRHSPNHPKSVTLYNGNRGTNGVFAGFSPDEVDGIMEKVTG